MKVRIKEPAKLPSPPINKFVLKVVSTHGDDDNLRTTQTTMFSKHEDLEKFLGVLTITARASYRQLTTDEIKEIAKEAAELAFGESLQVEERFADDLVLEMIALDTTYGYKVYAIPEEVSVTWYDEEGTAYICEIKHPKTDDFREKLHYTALF